MTVQMSDETIEIHKAREQLDRQIRDLNAQRNALAPISRLPAESLSHIFILARDEGFHYSPPSHAVHWDWKAVSQVCQYWRNVALGCPRLWSHVEFSHPDLAEEMLRRSKMAPLTIKAIIKDQVSCDSVMLALSQITRIREIHIRIETDNLEKFLDTAMSQDAPCLESLTISNDVRGHSRGDYALSNRLFCKTNQLRRLELVNCVPPWNSPLLSGLTYLKLAPSATSFVTVTQFLDILEKMPGLEVLHLQNCLPIRPWVANATTASYHTRRVIDLPHLSFIHFATQCLDRHHLESRIPEVTEILNCISLPQSASVRITGNCSPEEAFVLLRTLFKDLKTIVENPIRSLIFSSVQDSLEVYTRTYTDGKQPIRHLHPQLPAKEINLGLRWRQPIGDEARRQIVIKVLKILPLSDLHILRFHNSDIQAEDWLPAFGNPKNLETISVRENPSIIGALTRTADLERDWDANIVENGSDTKVSPILFPGLKYLDLLGLAFDKIITDHPMQHIDFHDLQDCLIQRYEKNTKIHRLRLSQCSGITQESIERLREVVVNVNWNDSWNGLRRRVAS